MYRYKAWEEACVRLGNIRGLVGLPVALPQFTSAPFVIIPKTFSGDSSSTVVSINNNLSPDCELCESLIASALITFTVIINKTYKYLNRQDIV